jgi:glutathione S-transferase
VSGTSVCGRPSGTMTKAILYSFRRCPYAMRARLALLVSGTAVELREVKLSAKPAEMTAVSPKATVPVLVLPDGSVIDESIDIMRWALRRHDPEHWLQGHDAALIAANDGTFKHHLDRYKYPNRHGSDPRAHRQAGMAFLTTLEDRLSRTLYLCGQNRTLSDAALMPFVRQFAATDRTWFDQQPLSGLQRWLATQSSSPLFEQAMIRLDPWRADHGPGPMLTYRDGTDPA